MGQPPAWEKRSHPDRRGQRRKVYGQAPEYEYGKGQGRRPVESLPSGTHGVGLAAAAAEILFSRASVEADVFDAAYRRRTTRPRARESREVTGSCADDRGATRGRRLGTIVAETGARAG